FPRPSISQIALSPKLSNRNRSPRELPFPSKFPRKLSLNVDINFPPYAPSQRSCRPYGENATSASPVRTRGANRAAAGEQGHTQTARRNIRDRQARPSFADTAIFCQPNGLSCRREKGSQRRDIFSTLIFVRAHRRRPRNYVSWTPARKHEARYEC